ncbi:NVEALA domain-containing protein [Bacteroides hominis]|uniref:NVEALA domain-containing protein n=1 Tax=Bacteroides hominis TaxID=2763023 RepID=UPI003D6A0441
MKKYLKAIGCFAIFVLAVFSYFREQSYKLNSLSLQNVEALAGDTEGGATITCSRTCSDGVGRCYKVYDDWGNCHFDGSQIYSCTC